MNDSARIGTLVAHLVVDFGRHLGKRWKLLIAFGHDD